MNYGQSQITNFDGGTPTFNVGIQKCFIKDLQFKSPKKDESGEKSLIVTLGNKEGAEERLIFWKINEEQVKSSKIVNEPIKYNSTIVYGDVEYKYVAGQNLTPQLALVQAYFEFDKKIKHIISKFTEDSVLLNVTSYETLAKAVIEKLKPFINIEIEGLFEYDKNDYVHLYSKIPFLQKSGENILSKSYSKAKLTKIETKADVDDILPFTTNDKWDD